MKCYKRTAKAHKSRHDILHFGLGGLAKGLIPEIKLSYNRGKLFLGKVSSSFDVADFIKKIYGQGQIELQECFIVIYLTPINEIIGYYKHSVGTLTETIVDTRIVFSVALGCLATGIIVAHNHPSGGLRPSERDNDLTRDLASAAETLRIQFMDHVIVTKNGYYSYSDHNKLPYQLDALKKVQP